MWILQNQISVLFVVYVVFLPCFDLSEPLGADNRIVTLEKNVKGSKKLWDSPQEDIAAQAKINDDNYTLLLEEAMSLANLALGKPTAQLSTAYEGTSDKAVDGNTDTNYVGSWSCTHTADFGATSDSSLINDPWWYVELRGPTESSVDVAGVIVYNRGDCCSNRLRDFEITVGDTKDGSGHKLCRAIVNAVHSGVRQIFICDKPQSGRYVRIAKSGDTPLTLCEVEVYSDISAIGCDSHNRALGRETGQISTLYSAHSSAAVDGDKRNTWQRKSCTHTIPGKDFPWWWVQIAYGYEEPLPVAAVRIHNKGDCCQQRLANFHVTVGNSEDGSDHSVCYDDTSATHEYLYDVDDFLCDEILFGRYVRIVKKKDPDPLTLCEVEVFSSLEDGNITTTTTTTTTTSPIMDRIAELERKIILYNQGSVMLTDYEIKRLYYEFYILRHQAGLDEMTEEEYNRMLETYNKIRLMLSTRSSTISPIDITRLFTFLWLLQR